MSYRPRDVAVTSRVMAAIKPKNNKTELELRRLLFARGLRYRVQYRGVPGVPDIAFPGVKLAIFIDGDFWHGRVLREQGLAGFYRRFQTARREWWREKLESRIQRDEYVTSQLSSRGWTVLRFWESDAAARLDETADIIAAEVLARRAEAAK
jgi:DNA mismatch endonuclease, patch repair protein